MEAPQSTAPPRAARAPSLLDPDPGPAATQAIGLLAALGAGATGRWWPRRAAPAKAVARRAAAWLSMKPTWIPGRLASPAAQTPLETML